MKRLILSLAVLLAAVCDYGPNQFQDGKIRSGQTRLSLDLVPLEKIISSISPSSGKKVGFKLETAYSADTQSDLVERYFRSYDLSMLVFNLMGEVSSQEAHQATIFTRDQEPWQVSSKTELAQVICRHILTAS